MSELATIREPSQLAAPESVNVGHIISTIMRQGIDPNAAAAAIKELVQLQNAQEDRFANRQWIDAFIEVRKLCKTIQAEKAVELQGRIAWHYAPLPDLLDAIEPICDKHGIAISFDSRRDGNLIIGVCIAYHRSGHSERREFAIREGQTMGKIADVGGVTTAQRHALKLMFGLKERHMEDGDARLLGDFISSDESAALAARVAATGRDSVKFLKFAGAPSFETIRRGRYDDCDRLLMKAELQMAPPNS